MSSYRVATPIEGPRIEVSEATIIHRAVNRLSFLLDPMFYEPAAERALWWSFGRREGYSEQDKREVQKEKGRTVSGVYGVVSDALDDLARVHGLFYPEGMLEWAWLIKEVEKAPLREWKGPDISCDLTAPIDCLDLLLNHPLGSSGAGSIQNFSPEGFWGLKVVIEDVRKKLHGILAELNSTAH